jgi:hemolysin III
MQQHGKGQRTPSPLPFQTIGEEIGNSILHGLGVLLAIAGLVLLTLRANGYLGGRGGGAPAVAILVIFTASMIILFLASTLYHGIQHRGAKRVFRILDHSAIYVLIAGTYTPFCLLGLRGAMGWAYFGAEWALAAAGISLYASGVRFIKKAELAIYIIMGWAILGGGFWLARVVPRKSMILLIAGGAAYTLGTFWYRRKNRPMTHVIWHVFVLAGAALHWWSIWFMS